MTRSWSIVNCCGPQACGPPHKTTISATITSEINPLVHIPSVSSLPADYKQLNFQADSSKESMEQQAATLVTAASTTDQTAGQLHNKIYRCVDWAFKSTILPLHPIGNGHKAALSASDSYLRRHHSEFVTSKGFESDLVAFRDIYINFPSSVEYQLPEGGKLFTYHIALAIKFPATISVQQWIQLC